MNLFSEINSLKQHKNIKDITIYKKSNGILIDVETFNNDNDFINEFNSICFDIILDFFKKEHYCELCTNDKRFSLLFIEV